MVKLRKLSCVVVGVVFACGCLWAGPTFHGVVESVVDGDTIKVRFCNDELQSVRFLGIDTPETHYMGYSQGYWGEEAAEFLKEKLPIGAEVEIRTGEALTGSYGRILGRIFYEGEDINLTLLREGLAVVYMIYPFDNNFLHQYMKASEEAISNHRGMFSCPDIELPYDFRMRVSNRPPTKFVGDYYTGYYYPPEYYKHIPIARRLFFVDEEDAIDAGFIRAH